MQYLSTHWTQIATVLGLWAALATFLVRVPWLTPDASSPKWEKALHTLLIDWPAGLPKVDFKGISGLPINIPFLTISREPAPREALPPTLPGG